MVLDNYQATGHCLLGMRRSVQRWAYNIVPQRMTGNKSNSELSGNHILLLVIFKTIWPQVNYYKCIAFIASETSNANIFNEKAVSRALCCLGYTRKVTSTVAYQALTDHNLCCCHMFWNSPWPLGIMGMIRRTLIDIDEFGLHLNAANRKFGLSPKGLKIRKPANYDRGTFKLTIILTVEAGDAAVAAGLPGLLARPRVWARISTAAGTSAEVYAAFVECVLNTCNVDAPMQSCPCTACRSHSVRNHQTSSLLNKHSNTPVVETQYCMASSLEDHCLTLGIPPTSSGISVDDWPYSASIPLQHAAP